MSVRWIGEAARELGIPVWDAIAALAKEDEYPMNGLLDEERFQLLKHATRRGVEASGSAARPATVLPPPPPYRQESTAIGAGRTDVTVTTATGVTTPLPIVKDRSEEKTVIYPSNG